MPVLGLEAPGGWTGAGLEQGYSCNPRVLRGGLQVTPSAPEQWAFRAGLGVSGHTLGSLASLTRSLDPIPSLLPSGPRPGWTTRDQKTQLGRTQQQLLLSTQTLALCLRASRNNVGHTKYFGDPGPGVSASGLAPSLRCWAGVCCLAGTSSRESAVKLAGPFRLSTSGGHSDRLCGCGSVQPGPWAHPCGGMKNAPDLGGRQQPVVPRPHCPLHSDLSGFSTTWGGRNRFLFCPDCSWHQPHPHPQPARISRADPARLPPHLTHFNLSPDLKIEI